MPEEQHGTSPLADLCSHPPASAALHQAEPILIASLPKTRQKRSCPGLDAEPSSLGAPAGGLGPGRAGLGTTRLCAGLGQGYPRLSLIPPGVSFTGCCCAKP